jgi:hypothetical protein
MTVDESGSFCPWPFWLTCLHFGTTETRDDGLSYVLICRRFKWHRGLHKNLQGREF